MDVAANTPCAFDAFAQVYREDAACPPPVLPVVHKEIYAVPEEVPVRFAVGRGNLLATESLKDGFQPARRFAAAQRPVMRRAGVRRRDRAPRLAMVRERRDRNSRLHASGEVFPISALAGDDLGVDGCACGRQCEHGGDGECCEFPPWDRGPKLVWVVRPWPPPLATGGLTERASRSRMCFQSTANVGNPSGGSDRRLPLE